jgi:carboxylesterase type B
LADTMSGAWVNFAKTGNPNGHNMPQWQAYNRDNGAVMVFDNQPHMKYHHDDELMKLLTTKQ